MMNLLVEYVLISYDTNTSCNNHNIMIDTSNFKTVDSAPERGPGALGLDH